MALSKKFRMTVRRVGDARDFTVWKPKPMARRFVHQKVHNLGWHSREKIKLMSKSPSSVNS